MPLNKETKPNYTTPEYKYLVLDRIEFVINRIYIISTTNHSEMHIFHPRCGSCG